MRVLSIAAILATSLAGSAHAEFARYDLDPVHTTVVFTVDHVGYAKTFGIFGSVEGSFDYDSAAKALGAVTVSIDAASVNTFDKSRDKHVRSADFLDAKSHPEITFTATGGTATSATSGKVTGDLTILGQTRPVTLDVTLNKAAVYPFGHKRETLGLSMRATINRSDFGMTYGVDNGLVGDVIGIQIETEALKMD